MLCQLPFELSLGLGVLIQSVARGHRPRILPFSFIPERFKILQILPLLEGIDEHLLAGHGSVRRHCEGVDSRRIRRRVNILHDELIDLANGLLRLRVLVITEVLMAF